MTPDNVAALRHRVVIERPVRVDDEGGAATVSWQAVATVWASVEATSGREFARADRPTARASTRIVMRYRDDVDASMRIVNDGQVFEIISAQDEEGRRRWLVCYCEVFGP